jgi:putative SOS response-associated peptidase YedK
MCGGYELEAEPEALVEAFRIDHNQWPELPRGEFFPRMQAPIVVARVAPDGRVERWLGPARWGLVPHWAQDLSFGDKLYNARAETLAQKPAFREALRRRRCVVPVTAFYEWTKIDGRTQRFVFRPNQGAFLSLAGLWETWRAPEGKKIGSFTVVTVPPNALVAPIHGRMPAVLDPASVERWLDPDADSTALGALLVPCAESWLSRAPG